MINSKRLVSMARKWQKITSIGRRRISIVKISNSSYAESCKPVADKGHFVVYTVDGRRFVVPLQYLKSPAFIELFRMSEDAFGIACNGPIILPCDGVFMEHVISLVRRRYESKRVEKALAFTIANLRGSVESALLPLTHYQEAHQHLPVHGF